MGYSGGVTDDTIFVFLRSFEVKLRTDDELIPVASSLKIPLGSSVFLN
jgi:hypothetical protein